MTIAWIVYSIAIAAILGVSALALEYGLCRRGIPLRWVWVAAMCGALMLSCIPWILARDVDPSDQKAGEPQAQTIPESATPSSVPYAELSPSAVVAAALSRSAIRESPIIPRIEQYFPYAWILASLGMAVYLGTAHRILSRRRRRWRLATLDGGTVLISKDLGPAVVGFIKPAIVLPEWVLGLRKEQRELILAHEKEHTQAGDAALLSVASLCLVLMPWNAPLWWHVRRLRHAIEIDCDARVLRATRDETAYGELLLDVSERVSLRWLGVATFGDSSSLLAGRIQNIIAPRPRAWRLFAGAGICAGGIFLVAACQMPRPTLGSGMNKAASPEVPSDPGELAARRESYTSTTATSPIGGVGVNAQSAAPGDLELIVGGRPNEEDIRVFLQRHHPKIVAYGLDFDQALWVAVDARGILRKSWVGPNLEFNFHDGFQPAPWLSLPEDSPERRRGYEAYARAENLELQRNVPGLPIRSQLTYGMGFAGPGSATETHHIAILHFVAESPGEPVHDGINRIRDLVIRTSEPVTN